MSIKNLSIFVSKKVKKQLERNEQAVFAVIALYDGYIQAKATEAESEKIDQIGFHFEVKEDSGKINLKNAEIYAFKVPQLIISRLSRFRTLTVI